MSVAQPSAPPEPLSLSEPIEARFRKQMLHWLLLFVGLGLVWRIGRFALAFPLWGDEAFIACTVLDRGFAELFSKPPQYFQVAPLLFLWADRACFVLFGPSEQALRLFSLLAGCAALLVFARSAWTALRPQAAAIATGIFAAGYPLVRATNEVKPYAGDGLAAVLILWAALRWMAQPERRGRALLFALITASALWLSFPAAIVAGGMGLALLFSLPRRNWPWLIGCCAAIACSGLAYYRLFASVQMNRSAGSWLEDYWRDGFPRWDDPAGFLGWLLRAHTSEMMAYPVGGQQFGSTATFVLCAAGAFALWRARKRGLLWVLLAPFAVGILAAVLHRYPYGVHPRLAQHLAPLICMLAGAGAVALFDAIRAQRLRHLVAGAFGLLLVALPVAGLLRDVLHPYKEDEGTNIRPMVAELRATLPAGARLALLNPREFGEQPDHAPQFSSTTRYYLLASGFELLWCELQPIPADVRVVVVNRKEQQPPRGADVEARVAAEARRITWVRGWLFDPEQRERLEVYGIEPIDQSEPRP